jgi:hypothetical protein
MHWGLYQADFAVSYAITYVNQFGESPESHWSEQVDIKEDVKAVQVSVRHLSERFCFLNVFSRSLIFIQSSSPTTLPPALNLLRVLMESQRSPTEVSVMKYESDNCLKVCFLQQKAIYVLYRNWR